MRRKFQSLLLATSLALAACGSSASPASPASPSMPDSRIPVGDLSRVDNSIATAINQHAAMHAEMDHQGQIEFNGKNVSFSYYSIGNPNSLLANRELFDKLITAVLKLAYDEYVFDVSPDSSFLLVTVGNSTSPDANASPYCATESPTSLSWGGHYWGNSPSLTRCVNLYETVTSLETNQGVLLVGNLGGNLGQDSKVTGSNRFVYDVNTETMQVLSSASALVESLADLNMATISGGRMVDIRKDLADVVLGDVLAP